MNMSIVRHELRQVICNHKTWFCLAVIQMLLGIIFNWLIINFLKNQAITETMHYGITEEVIHPFYACITLIALLFIPIIATQMICAEKQHGTIINYYCAPISGLQIILGKFITFNIIVVTLLGLTSIMPLTITISGTIDWGQYLATLIGVYLMLNAVIAICLGLAAFMSNIVRANLFIAMAVIGLVLIEWVAQYAGSYAIFLQTFGLLKPLKAFFAGIISVRLSAYYILITMVFLWLGSKSHTLRSQDV